MADAAMADAAIDGVPIDAALPKALSAFAFLSANNPVLTTDVTGSIIGTTIAANLPFGTSLSSLKATFSSTGTGVAVGSTQQMSGVTSNDFTNPVVYRINAADGSTTDYTVNVTAARAQQAMLTASNPDSFDQFGWSVALSADGTTLAVGSFYEGSAATGIGGNQADNSVPQAGAVYVFSRTGATWTQQAYVKASNTGTNDWFGHSVALSNDGSTLAVGAPWESSGATGIGGNQADNSAFATGAVYVFTRSATTWSQQAYVKPSITGVGNQEFGTSVALSADGSTLAAGASWDPNAASGINTTPSGTASEAGAAYVFTRSGTTWSQQAYFKASNPDAGDKFGTTVALSSDGDTLAVAAPNEASGATGIGGNQADNSAFQSGAVYMFKRSGTVWSQEAYVKASSTTALDHFGSGIGVSAGGSTLAVGAAGSVYVFTRAGATWSQRDLVTPPATYGFAGNVAFSADGSTLAVSAGKDTMVPGMLLVPAVVVLGRSGTTWDVQSEFSPPNPFGFGCSLALSDDGVMLAVGAWGFTNSAGAVHVFR